MSLLYFVFRKREEEQRRREAGQQDATDKQRVPLMRTEQEMGPLVNNIGDLTMSDAAVETKKSTKDERGKSKVERHKGTCMQKRHVF